MSQSWKNLVRLAYENPELRDDLFPLISSDKLSADSKGKGETWRTSGNNYGAKNQNGTVKYFSNQQKAKAFAKGKEDDPKDPSGNPYRPVNKSKPSSFRHPVLGADLSKTPEGFELSYVEVRPHNGNNGPSASEDYEFHSTQEVLDYDKQTGWMGKSVGGEVYSVSVGHSITITGINHEELFRIDEYDYTDSEKTKRVLEQVFAQVHTLMERDSKKYKEIEKKQKEEEAKKKKEEEEKKKKEEEEKKKKEEEAKKKKEEEAKKKKDKKWWQIWKRGSSQESFRSLIKMAYENPELRGELLPVIEKHGNAFLQTVYREVDKGRRRPPRVREEKKPATLQEMMEWEVTHPETKRKVMVKDLPRRTPPQKAYYKAVLQQLKKKRAFLDTKVAGYRYLDSPDDPDPRDFSNSEKEKFAWKVQYQFYDAFMKHHKGVISYFHKRFIKSFLSGSRFPNSRHLKALFQKDLNLFGSKWHDYNIEDDYYPLEIALEVLTNFGDYAVDSLWIYMIEEFDVAASYRMPKALADDLREIKVQSGNLDNEIIDVILDHLKRG